MSVFRIADLEIGAVKVTVVFAESGADWLAEDAERLFDRLNVSADYRSSERVLIWKDDRGAMRFIASPQLHLFFERVGFDQLAAQVTREISIS